MQEQEGAAGGGLQLWYLPIEMVLHVFSFVPVQTLVVLSEVSKYTRQLADSPMLWRALLQRHSPTAGIQKEDVERFGWKALARTHVRTKCFRCGGIPSAVFLFDNTRRCHKC